MLASAAAPTYFPARTLRTEVVVDGGVAANSPELIALTDAIRFKRFKIEDMHVLSIGTASESLVRAPEEPNRSGVLGWMARRKLFQVSMECQSGLAVSQCSALLGDRYLRMDQSPGKDQAKNIGLDVADANAVATLRDLADACWKGLATADAQILRRMFRHTTG